MPKVTTLPIGAGWLPDLEGSDVLRAGGLRIAKNVLPVRGGYFPMRDKVVFNNTAVTGNPLAGACMEDPSGSWYNFLGTSTKLYRFNKSALTDVTRLVGGNYNGTLWRLCEYGDWVIATNYSDDPQVLKGFTSANFAALGGTPPKAKYALVNSGHLVLAYLNDGTARPKKAQWSARENPEAWAASLTTGAGSQDFPEAVGPCTGLARMGSAFVLTSQGSVTIGYYIGSTYTFGFKWNAVRDKGNYYPGSLVSIGDAVFFWGKDSIYRYDGAALDDVAHGKVKETMMGNINQSFADRVSAAHDKARNLIFWAYPSVESSGDPDRILVYNYYEKRFTLVEMATECIFVGASGGYTIDEVSSIIDSVDTMIDASYWASNSQDPMCVDPADGKVRSFIGAQLQAEIETGEVSDSPYLLFSRGAWSPAIELAGSESCYVKHRYSKAVSQSQAGPFTRNSDGAINFRVTDRNLAYNFRPQNFQKIGSEVMVDYQRAGIR